MEKNLTPISIIIPTRNSSDSIASVMRPLLEELTPEDEVLVVDDGSNDGTRQKARELGAMVIDNVNNPGAAGARNTGGEAASREWLLFVDSDAVAPSGWRGHLQDRIDQDPSAVQATYSPRAKGGGAATFYKNYYYYYTFTRRIRSRFIEGCGTFFFAVDRNRFCDLDGFDDMIPGATVEDADFAARLAGSGGSIMMAPEIEVLHLREYTFRQLMRYEWRMMKSKTLYLLRRDSYHAYPTVSMAKPIEMLPVIAGAAAIWLIPFGCVIRALGHQAGGWIALAGLLTVFIGHAGFWFSAVRRGGFRGVLASLITFPDLAMVVPAFLAGVLKRIRGRKY